jgi:CheY-like chemotaxis protein
MPQILLVDDQPDSANMLRLVLEGRGYQVVCGRSGDDGLRLLATGTTPDAIISSLHMAGGDGLTFLGQVRRNPLWSSIPFVMMSAIAAEDRRQAAFQCGADAFLLKPFRFEDLNNILCNLGVLPARVSH